MSELTFDLTVSPDELISSFVGELVKSGHPENECMAAMLCTCHEYLITGKFDSGLVQKSIEPADDDESDEESEEFWLDEDDRKQQEFEASAPSKLFEAAFEKIDKLTRLERLDAAYNEQKDIVERIPEYVEAWRQTGIDGPPPALSFRWSLLPEDIMRSAVAFTDLGTIEKIIEIGNEIAPTLDDFDLDIFLHKSQKFIADVETLYTRTCTCIQIVTNEISFTLHRGN